MTLRSLWRVTPEFLKAPLRRVRDRANRVRERAEWQVRRRRTLRRAAEPVTLPETDPARETILIFVPYAGVRPFYAMACVLARVLQDRGHRVLVTRCYRLFERCPAMDNARLPYDAAEEDVAEVCLQCAANSFDMADEYRIETIDLRALVTPEIRMTVREALAGAPQNLLQFEFDGEAIGKLSAVDLVLAKKISRLDDVPESVRVDWLRHIGGGVLAYLTIGDLCRRYGVTRYVHVLDYGLALSGMRAATKAGAKSYGASPTSHRNVDFSRYTFWTDVWKPSSFHQLAAWPTCRELPLEPERVREIAEDQLVRLGGMGSHIYSPAKTAGKSDPRPGWGLATDRKLLVAYTSSLDEVVATRLGLEGLRLTVPERAQPFEDQVRWLRALTEFVAKSDDLQLVVRVHPREGATKHSTVASEHLALLRENFSQPAAHCRFIWPAERISSYDLAEAADLVLNSWSTLGLEVARLGVPLLIAFNGSWAAMPQDDFFAWEPTPDAYFQRLRSLLREPVTLAKISRAYRWYNQYHLGASFDIGDVVPSSTFMGLPKYGTPREAQAIEDVLVRGCDPCAMNIERMRSAQLSDSAGREEDELRRQLRRLIHHLSTGESSPVDRPLRVDFHESSDADHHSAAARRSAEECRVLEINGPFVRYTNRDSHRSTTPATFRYSPMIARLGPLAASQAPDSAPHQNRFTVESPS